MYNPVHIFRRMFTGHQRTVLAKKNVLALLVLRVSSTMLSLLLVPMTLHAINAENYGIWLTLSSVFGWLSIADVGLGNGLRNKFAEARAKGDVHLARTYISTAYVLLTAIVLLLAVVCIPLSLLLPWNEILNVRASADGGLTSLATIVLILFCVRFVASLIFSVAAADQMPAINGVVDFGGNALSLLLVYLSIRSGNATLFTLGIGLSVGITVAPIVATVVLFRGRYRQYAPSLRFVHLPYAKELLNLGVQFFAIQISALVMYTTSNIIITQLFGPAEVTPYNIAFRYFGIVTTAFGLITAPLWSAFSEAYFSNDLLWVRKVTNTMIRIWCVLIAVVVVMIFASDFVYRLWIGKGVLVPFALSLWMGIFVILMAWGQIFVNFINGTGKIRLQLYASVGSAVLNIPIALVLVQVFHFGIAGVIMATCLLQAVTSLWIPIQYRKLVSGTAKGIWAR